MPSLRRSTIPHDKRAGLITAVSFVEVLLAAPIDHNASDTLSRGSAAVAPFLDSYKGYGLSTNLLYDLVVFLATPPPHGHSLFAARVLSYATI